MEVDQEKLKLIFREYDIRGIAGRDFEPEIVEEYEKWYGPFPGLTITPEVSRLIGRALGSHLKVNGGKKIIVGYEVRPNADILKDEFIEGLLDAGIDVDDADKVVTPFIYFLTDFLGYDGGVNITGSHNVYFYNGYKILQTNYLPLYGDELKLIYDRIVNEDFELVDRNERGKKGLVENPFEIYKKYFLEHNQVDKKLRVVIDCGNGTPGLFAKELFESLGVEIIEELYFEPDAKFPNHVPDPESPINMSELIRSVKENVADLGIGFDADGDRVGFVNEKGEYIFADDILLLLAKDISERKPGAKVLFDVKCSKLLISMLEEMNLKPVMHRTGHAPIKDTIRKNDDIVLGGEFACHFYFTENYPKADDGFWAAAQVLKIISKSNQTISELLDFIPKRVKTPEIKLPCVDEMKFKIVQEVKEELEQLYEIIDIDGVRVNFSETSWGLVRASNTSPYLTIRVEGENDKEVLKIKNIFADILEKHEEIGDKLDRNNPFSPTGVLGFV